MTEPAEMGCDDFRPTPHELCSECGFAETRHAGYPEYSFSVLIGQPAIDRLEDPLPPGKAGDMLIDFGLERQRVKMTEQLSLHAFEV
jgi:hypothetical protein